MLFDELLFKHQPIFIPNEVGSLSVDVVFLHAPFKQSDDVAVVGILSEAEASAVVHEFSELFGLVLAEIVDSRLLLLLFDVGVLFRLRPSWQTLPR
mgnify:CR=1 FL=1